METYRHMLDVIGNFLYGVNPPFDGSNLYTTIALCVFGASIIMIITLRSLNKKSPSILMLSVIVAIIIFGTILCVPLRHEMKFFQCEMRELIVDGQAVDLRYCRYRKTLDSNYGDWRIVVSNK